MVEQLLTVCQVIVDSSSEFCKVPAACGEVTSEHALKFKEQQSPKKRGRRPAARQTFIAGAMNLES